VYNNEKYCYIEYSHPGEDLLDSIKKQLHYFISENGYFPNIILLQNHGIIACGKSIKQCVYNSQIAEKSAEIFIGSKLLGEVNYLSDLEMNNIKKDKKEQYRKSLT
jgi:L-fuculose-phosphate aldolase